MSQKNVGIVDMGTNTFHLLIASVGKGKPVILEDIKLPVRLGQRGISNGYITDEAMERAAKALGEFNKLLKSYMVSEVHSVATSATRSARNGSEFLRMIKDIAGLEPEVLSGPEEARYIFEGVKAGLAIGPQPVLVMDIGGGSVEFIIGKESGILWLESFEVGAQRLVDLFHHQDPIGPEAIQQLEAFLTKALISLQKACLDHRPKVLVGSSGTFDTLSEMYCLANGITADARSGEIPLTLKGYLDLHRQLITKNQSQRLSIPGMLPMRVDMIVVASCLVNFILQWLDISNIRVSTHALKEGVLFTRF